LTHGFREGRERDAGLLALDRGTRRAQHLAGDVDRNASPVNQHDPV
jgi:hypothetical protein